jgi:hypothetical protein
LLPGDQLTIDHHVALPVRYRIHVGAGRGERRDGIIPNIAAKTLRALQLLLLAS